MRRGAVLALGLTALSCASMRHYETTRVVGERRVNERMPPVSSDQLGASLVLVDDTLIVELTERRACRHRTGQVMKFELRKGSQADDSAVAAEGTCAVLGALAMLQRVTCTDSGEWACFEQSLVALVGFPVFIGCGIAVLVDAHAGSETVETYEDDQTTESVVDCSTPLRQAPVELQLPDGTERIGRSDVGGHARFDLSDAPWQDGQLRVGVSSAGRPVARKSLKRSAE